MGDSTSSLLGDGEFGKSKFQVHSSSFNEVERETNLKIIKQKVKYYAAAAPRLLALLAAQRVVRSLLILLSTLTDTH